MSDPLEFVPGYVSPLTEKEHAQIGRIAILWGQIEYYVEGLLPRVTGLSWAELQTIGVTNKPIAAKVDFLTAAKARVSNAALREMIGAFCTAIHDTKLARNHVFHGIWGWRADVRTKSVFAAARKTAQPKQPFKASQLQLLEKRLCACSRKGADIWAYYLHPGKRIRLSRFIHHGGKEEIPEWLEQWSARNPLGDDALDRSAKVGQLPRLATPFPRK